MEKINIYNYEAYLLDFSEGSLTNDQQMDLELFLIQHPELNIDLTELSLVLVEKEEMYFAQKNDLRKSEADLISETQFITYIENQLPAKDRLNLEKGCALNPALAKDLILYQQTIQKADPSIIYSNKDELKQHSKIIWFNFSTSQYAAAACVLFLIGLFVMWPKPYNTDFNSKLAEQNTPKVIEKNNTSSKKDNTSPKLKTLETSTIAYNSEVKNKVKNAKASLIHNSVSNTVSPIPNEPSPVVEQNKNESLIALNQMPVETQSQTTVIEVITENDEEQITATPGKRKKGLWAIASKALKNLNQVGVKSVNGNENENKDKAFYALTLGGINITHKATNL